jgi:hypothetical protein
MMTTTGITSKMEGGQLREGSRMHDLPVSIIQMMKRMKNTGQRSDLSEQPHMCIPFPNEYHDERLME